MNDLTPRTSTQSLAEKNALNVTRGKGFNALSKPQQQAHREKVGVRSQAILSAFWVGDEPDAIKALEMESWMDVLEGCREDEIRKAWADYIRTGPRTLPKPGETTGKLIKPDPGAINIRVLSARPRPKSTHIEPNVVETERCSPEAAKRIMSEFRGGIRKMPGAGT